MIRVREGAVLVDTNVLMYAAGAEHRHRSPSLGFLGAVSRGEIDAVINVETLQEVLYRYRSLGRWSDGLRVYDLARDLFPLVLPTTVEVMDRSRQLLDEVAGLMTRDAIHAAVVQEYGLDAICSFDADFDAIPGLRRIEPGRDLLD